MAELRFAAYMSKPIRRGPLVEVICRLVAESSQGQSKEGEQAQGGVVPMRKKISSVVASRLSLANGAVSVLVVEDNEVNRQVLSAFLRQSSFRVVEAVNGAEALQRLEEKVDVVLMDIHMPVLDGISAMRIMKEKGCSVPVVVVTADVTEENRIKCEEAGAVKVLLKPINLKQLDEVLTAVLAPVGESLKVCLIADMVETSRSFAAHIVQKICGPDMRILFASTGVEAIQVVNEHSLEFVLIDLKVEGVETTRRIRELDSSVKIFGVTGSRDTETVQMCKKAGMNEILLKPLKLEDLSRVIRPHHVETETPQLFDGSFLEDVDEDFRRSLLADWKASLTDNASAMKRHIDGNDWAALEKTAHSAKGAAAQIGACLISNIAKEIEFEAKKHPPTPFRLYKCLDELSLAMEETFRHLYV
jgi:CheY-like chemotaxis protein